jgi:hypothetical protein
MKIVLYVCFWLACGVLDAGLMTASDHRRSPNMDFSDENLVLCVIFGPLWLPLEFLHWRPGDGWTLSSPMSEQLKTEGNQS